MNDILPQKNTQNNVEYADSTQLVQQKEKDNASDYFSERAKKMVTAVYLVSNLIPSNDPLRLSIRDFSIRLLSILGFESSKYSLSDTASEVRGLCKKITEMLEIAFFSGYVSEMNFSVLKSEFDAFMNELVNYENYQVRIVPESLKVGVVADKTSAAVSMLDVAQKSPFPISLVGMKRSSPERKSLPSSTSRNVAEAKKTSRKEAILSIIKRRGAVSIKDISAVILDCSEKTIQRELMNLVTENVLKKTGDRRWSTYSLAE